MYYQCSSRFFSDGTLEKFQTKVFPSYALFFIFSPVYLVSHLLWVNFFLLPSYPIWSRIIFIPLFKRRVKMIRLQIGHELFRTKAWGHHKWYPHNFLNLLAASSVRSHKWVSRTGRIQKNIFFCVLANDFIYWLPPRRGTIHEKNSTLDEA